MTEDGAEEAYLKLAEKEAENKLPKVLIILLPDTHESLVGIIAGRVKERYNRPTIVFTETEDGLVKGSGRSIEAYDLEALSPMIRKWARAAPSAWRCRRTCRGKREIQVFPFLSTGFPISQQMFSNS